jgi:hypothetical protein
MNDQFKLEMEILMKADDDKHRVFGLFSVIEEEGEVVIDKEGDMITPDELEEGAYEFVKSSRVAGEAHVKKGIGTLIESVVLTKEKQQLLGIDLKKVCWFGGFEITDADVWEKVKKGIYKSFSIGGKAIRIPVEDSK